MSTDRATPWIKARMSDGEALGLLEGVTGRVYSLPSWTVRP